MGGYTETLAIFCANLKYDTLPQNIRDKTKWVILDHLGIVLGGATMAVGKMIAKYAQTLGDRLEATVLGFGFKSSARTAAFVNGSLSEILEMQDGYTKGGTHPSDATIAASVAMGEWLKKKGKDIIPAVVVGYEVANRVAETVHPTHFARGFLPTGTIGTLGAAAAAGKIIKLNEIKMLNALGIAGFMLPVVNWDSHFGTYSIKQVQGGISAKIGIESALMAKQGLTGAPLEGDPKVQKGVCRILSDEPPKFEKMIEGLGEKYTMEEVYFKPYASCRMNHGPIQLALDLKKQHKLNVDEIDAIRVKTYDFPVQRTGSIKTDVHSPFTVCQFSMSYAVAGALLDGEAGLRQLTPKRILDPKIHELGSKLRAVADPELQKMYPACRPYVMEIRMKDGSSVTGRVDYPKGDHRNPMTEEEMRAKFLGLAKEVLGEEKAKKAMEIVLDLEHLDSMAALIRHLK
jgi:2-methylcitrate dehydratase PrpD